MDGNWAGEKGNEGKQQAARIVQLPSTVAAQGPQLEVRLATGVC